MVNVDKGNSILNHENGVVLHKNVSILVMKMEDAQNHCR